MSESPVDNVLNKVLDWSDDKPNWLLTYASDIDTTSLLGIGKDRLGHPEETALKTSLEKLNAIQQWHTQRGNIPEFQLDAWNALSANEKYPLAAYFMQRSKTPFFINMGDTRVEGVEFSSFDPISNIAELSTTGGQMISVPIRGITKMGPLHQ